MPPHPGTKRSSGPNSEGPLPSALYRLLTVSKTFATAFCNSAKAEPFLQTVTPLLIGIQDFEVAGRLRVSCGFVRVRIKMLTATRMRTRNLENLCVNGQSTGKVTGK
jgi:hypothetical protein